MNKNSLEDFTIFTELMIAVLVTSHLIEKTNTIFENNRVNRKDENNNSLCTLAEMAKCNNSQSLFAQKQKRMRIKSEEEPEKSLQR